MAGTHFSNLKAKAAVFQGADPQVQPRQLDYFFDALNNRWAVYNNGQWVYSQLTTTTSTSSSTTTTSTSTTSTSTSTTSSTSTSTSSTTSTTTTL